MSRLAFGIVVGIAWLAAACGDNSRVCGPGTVEREGTCEVDTGPGICGDGTMLDPETGECVLADGVCGNGTVLINGECVDPTTGLDVNLLEAAEPNGFEADATPAGIINLMPEGGDGFTIHGCIKPLDGETPDFDRYFLTVTGPTLIKIEADGVQGLAGGFFVQGDPANPKLATWQRLGISMLTDTAKREVFLPAAGRYDVVITDSRTVFPITEGNFSLPVAGDLEGNSCYYVTIFTRAIVPQPLDLAVGDAGAIGEDLKFYTAAFPTGLSELTAVIDGEDLEDSHAASALVVLNNGELRQVNDADHTSPVSTALVGGITSGDDTLVVLDYVWNTAIGPVDYAVTSLGATASQALSRNGGSINATSRGQSVLTPGGDAILANANLFHFEVTGTEEVVGLDFLSSIQLQGMLLDQDGEVASQLTGLVGNATSSTTFAGYLGLVRTRTPGTYYLLVFAPRNPVGTAFTVATTITPQPFTTVAFDATLSFSFNAFSSKAFGYDAGAEPWQQVMASGTNTGVLAVQLFERASAFGRLDALPIRTGGGAGVASTLASSGCATCDVSALEELVFAQDGSTIAGRILRNPIALTPPAATELLVNVNPTVLAGTRPAEVGFSARLYDDLGALAVGGTAQDTETISPALRERRYFVEAPQNAVVTVDVTPTAPLTLNAEIALLDTKEGDVRVIDATPTTGAEQLEFAAFGGFGAFEVRGGTAASQGNYTVTVSVAAPLTYAAAAGTTAFADACIGGTAVALSNTDDGLSAAGGIPVPAGFTLFGAAVGSFRVSSNGFLTFALANANSLPDNQSLPTLVGTVAIAPYWDDLGNVAVCRKVVAGKLVVQWTGDDFLDAVQFQAILDPVTDSVEFVYGPNHRAGGAAATAGVQGLLGVQQVSPGSSTKLTPQ